MGDVLELRSRVRAADGPAAARADEIERFCVRLELAWRRRPDLRLGQLIAKAQANTLAAQVNVVDEALVAAVEKFAGVAT